MRGLGASWGRPGGVLGASWGVLGCYGPSWGHLGGVLGASWGRLGAILGRPGAILSRLGALLGESWAVLEPSWGLLAARTQQEPGPREFLDPIGPVLASFFEGFWMVLGMNFQYFSYLVSKDLNMSESQKTTIFVVPESL